MGFNWEFKGLIWNLRKLVPGLKVSIFTPPTPPPPPQKKKEKDKSLNSATGRSHGQIQKCLQECLYIKQHAIS
jgi:hypothetical protein